jgi:hypothetical protein
MNRGEAMSWIRDRIAVEPPHAPPYVLEDMARTRPVRLGSVLGIDWLANPAGGMDRRLASQSVSSLGM